jgi:hypothetical protein
VPTPGPPGRNRPAQPWAGYPTMSPGSRGSTAPAEPGEAPAPVPRMPTPGGKRARRAMLDLAPQVRVPGEPGPSQVIWSAGSLPDLYMTCHIDSYVIRHVCCRGEGTGPPGPGHATTGIRGLGMTERARDLAKRGPAASLAGAGRSAGWRAWWPRAQQPGSPGRAGAPGMPHRCPGPGRGAAAGSPTLLSHA